ncbi:MAG: D-alanyl-D-alanine carboxypeptidase, partial [Candidatus Sumerlaeota bacterium]|nr:D-alanyl-D-alanine carboxypeptidase [Candidatus Sumerlaeota bacterium]
MRFLVDSDGRVVVYAPRDLGLLSNMGLSFAMKKRMCLGWVAAVASSVLLTAGAGWAQIAAAPQSVFARRVADQMSRAPFSEAYWGIMVQDLATGEEIYSHDADKLFMPASNRKLFTTSLALDTLGADYCFHTRFEKSGEVGADGALRGDLIVRASGDPTISGRFRPDQDAMAVFSGWAKAAREAGIRRVTGSLIVDTSMLSDTMSPRGEGWSWDYESDYYAAPVGAFS